MKSILKLILLIYLTAQNAYADQSTNVAAVIGDEVISVYDLKKRIQLIVNSQANPVNVNDIQKIIPLALQELLDEKLLEKEARRYNISVSENEIKDLINKLSIDNHIESLKFEEVMKSRNIPIESLKHQLKGQLLKSKIVSDVILPRLNVSEKEIHEAVNTNNNSEIDLNLKRIFVGFSGEKDLEKKRRSLNDLRSKITGCANLEQLILKNYPGFELEHQNIKAKDLTDLIRGEILNTEIDKATKVMKSPSSLQFYTVCSKEYVGLSNNEKNAIYEMLLQNKISLQLNLYMVQLRKKTHIEIKTENLEHLTFSPSTLNAAAPDA